MRIFHHRFLVMSLLVTGLTGLAYGDRESAAPSIITKSPFLPPDFNPPGGAGAAGATAPASASQYEFRGVYQMEGVYYFNLFNTRDRKGTWITDQSGAGDGPRIIRYDLQEDTLIVDVGGERVSLSMVETSNKPMPVANTRPTTPRPTPRATTAASNAKPANQPAVRRRVIRPTTRPTATSASRRATMPASNSTQQKQ
jgi:hypothetical protein